MSIVSALSRLLSLKDLLLSRVSQFDSMMTGFLKECSAFGIEVIDCQKSKRMATEER
jgi:hypothetical protein